MVALQLLLIGIVCNGFARSKCDVLLILLNNYTLRVGDPVPFYRFKKNTYNLFYTTNSSEIGKTTVGAVGLHGFVYEGVSCLVYATSDTARPPSTVPFYRYVWDGTDRHFYTASDKEIGTTVVGQIKDGWKYEGIAAYIFSTPQFNTKPLYRYFNAAQSSHLYTINAAEIGSTTADVATPSGYTYEGIAGYVNPTSSSAGD